MSSAFTRSLTFNGGLAHHSSLRRFPALSVGLLHGPCAQGLVAVFVPLPECCAHGSSHQSACRVWRLSRVGTARLGKRLRLHVLNQPRGPCLISQSLLILLISKATLYPGAAGNPCFMP